MGEMVEIAATLSVPSYIARPTGIVKGGVIVIHEVWGLTKHIESVADRFADEGYVALAPDLLSGTDVDVSSVIDLQEALFDPERRAAVQPELRKVMVPLQNPEFGVSTTERLKACFEYLYNLPKVHQEIAVVGFCFGGTYGFNLATAEPRLKLAVPFYGHADLGVEDLRHIACPITAFYGENDERLTSQLPALKERMKAAGVDFTAKVYPNCGHAFFNDTNSFTYNPKAAENAWQRTLTLFKKNLAAS